MADTSIHETKQPRMDSGPWGQSIQALPEGTEVHLWLDNQTIQNAIGSIGIRRRGFQLQYDHCMGGMQGFIRQSLGNVGKLPTGAPQAGPLNDGGDTLGGDFFQTALGEFLDGHGAFVGIVVADGDGAGGLLFFTND